MEPLPPTFVEALEARIAPAVIYAGPTAAGGQDYDDAGTPFQLASAAPVSGASLNFDASHFYLDLKSGDTVKMYSTSGFSDFIKVTGGRAYAVFFDKDGDFIPEADELTGLAVSAGANITVKGSVDGDVLAILDSKTGVLSTESLISNKQNIAGLNIGGDVNGDIVAGGNLANVIVGSVGYVKSGTAAAFDYDFGGTGAGAGVGEGTIAAFDPGAKQVGGNLTSIQVKAALGIYGGNGGSGAIGGSITGLTVVGDADGILVAGGAGGVGIATSVSGASGGKVSKVVFAGVNDSSPSDLISIQGGAGGDAFAGSTGTGGAGGTVDNIWVGYEYNSSKKIVESAILLNDDVDVAGGNGGDGATAGNGGNASYVYLLGAPVENVGNPEFWLHGGDAGDLFAAGKKAGTGGSVSTFKIQNMDLNADAGDVLVQGGNASAWNLGATTPGTAAAGGSISNPVPKSGEVWLVGKSFAFQGGDGSDTASGGGAGGSVTNVYFKDVPNLFLEDLSVTAGAGGTGLTGAGGNGGNVSGIFSPLANLNTFAVTAGAGGDSLGDGTKGNKGGNGGSISNVQIFDIEGSTIVGVTGTAGAGGAGFSGGGIGGGINGFSFFGEYASLTLLGGAGGNVIGAKGNGGAGGTVTGVSFNSESSTLPLTQTAVLTGGAGGNGPGAGGIGGSVTKSNVQTMGNVIMTGGLGGSAGDKGKIGAGGSVGSSSNSLGVFARSEAASVSFAAGNAGGVLAGTPTTGAAGGFVQNATASAAGDISFLSGNGSVGGNGGDIAKIGFYGESGSNDIPSGNISVLAGNGGAAITATGASGRGGNVTTLVGYSSSDASATVTFAAGTGGNGGKGGAGGSFSGLTIYDGTAEFSVVAGNGGSGSVSAGIGGSVSSIAVVPDLVIRAIAAGDGGDTTAGKGKGANGGSVSGINVNGDIGIRSGKSYGFATDGSLMGGIFAGKAGVNTVTPADTKLYGIAGNVTNVTAKAISAIVAGRAASPQLVNKVDGIFLGGNIAAKVDGTGAFTNFSTANLVGGKAGDPTLADADDFHFAVGAPFSPSGTTFSPWTLGTTQPLDGLIAALTLTTKRNFTPLAFLTNTETNTKLPPVYGLYVPTVATV